MYRVKIRFYEELNDFLPPDKKKKEFSYSFTDKRSIKDLIESLGVPHVEIDLILVNGKSVDFSYTVKDGDRISVYPVFETFPIKNVTRLRPESLREPKFICDVHLGKLARRLRLLGLDVKYRNHLKDEKLSKISEKEKRILLTRDTRLLMRKNVKRGILIRSCDPEEQVIEVLDRLNLKDELKPFTRCLKCNGLLVSFSKKDKKYEQVKSRIPPKVKKWCAEFSICKKCGKIYWRGSHYKNLIKKVKNYLN